MASKRKTILLPYQARWVSDRGPLKIWLAARQVGKSFALAMEAVTEALGAKCNNMLLSTSLRQSKELMQKVFQHLRYLGARTEGDLSPTDQTKEEVVLHNGSRIISLPASPDTVRGFSGNVFLDEFAFQQDSEAIWRAMYPTVTRGFKVRVTSTPNGKQNMFYRIWEVNDEFSRHRTDIYNAVREGLDVDIEKLRAGIGDPDAWAQEFECQFVDEATAYLTYELITACEDGMATMERPTYLAPDAEMYLGIDVGRKHDLTVMWLLEKVGDIYWTRLVKLMRKTQFSVQRDYLNLMMETLPIRRCCMDATGIGAQLAEEAQDKFGARVEPVTFTSPVKQDLAVTLRRGFEDRLIRIPADKDIREDLHSVQKVTTPAGNIRFDAARTDALGHADRFWALALAAHAGGTPSAPVSYEAVDTRACAFKGAGCW